VVRVAPEAPAPPVPPYASSGRAGVPGYPSPVRIYTRTGDDGTTGLLYGTRVSKADPVTEAYGTTDEAVAVLGLARALCEDGDVADELLRLQRELFVVGADLATNPGEREKLQPSVSLVTPEMVARLETLIDATVAEHPLPRAFIVPGATSASAAIDLARSTVRRAERRTIELREAGREVNLEVARYLNRLSDALFVLARKTATGTEEPLSREGG
jgi:cob(I)alamin adenosyltransferase